MTKFHDYKLIYNDGDTTITSIRLSFNDAKKYYLNQTFEFWCGVSNSEKSKTVIGIDFLGLSDF